jgi:sugar phosphate isomerase/epimerase
MNHASVSRRSFLAAAGVAALSRVALRGADSPVNPGAPTRFQIACLTLPYSQFPLERALSGIKSAGYQNIAWGTTHKESGGKPVPLMATDAPPSKARDLARQCRDIGLEPVLMFSTVYPEAKDGLEILTRRVEQAGAAGIPQVLTFGHTKGDNRQVWIQRFKQLGPIARDHGVVIVVKQHGGETGTGKVCAEIALEVGHNSIKVCYDAGNVMDYLHIDPIPDIQVCASEVRSFCIKDHRRFPKDEDCGPGLGEIDHYKLLHPVAFTGLTMPLCCENIFAPVVPRPTDPAGVDALARRAREFLETVIAGLQHRGKP